MYKLYKYIPVIEDVAYQWDEVCATQNPNYITQLAEGMTRVDGRGRYRYCIDDLTFEVMRLGHGKYRHVKIN